MKYKSLLNYSLDKMKTSGADKSQVTLITTEKHELNTEANRIKLLRSTEDVKLSFIYIKDQKKASITVNKATEDAVDEAINKLVVLAESAPVDEANDIADAGPAKKFNVGLKEADLDALYKAVKEFTIDMKTKYPKVLGEMIISYDYSHKYVYNSNGLNLQETHGSYNSEVQFAAKDCGKTSSINETYGSTLELKTKLSELFMLRELMDQNIKELDVKSFAGKFVGDVIITPLCLGDYFLDSISSISLTDGALIAGSSMLKDSIDEQIAAPIFNWHSNPRDKSLASGYAITEDGFVAEDLTIVKDGVLKKHLLSQYGAKKLNAKRANNYGGAFIVEPGSTSLDKMIRNVKKGILLGRFSGPEPSADGGFSGVAKNSLYIEDGKIQYPITETMISGNLFDILKNIKSISDRTINFGSSILPWIHTTGTTISGK